MKNLIVIFVLALCFGCKTKSKVEPENPPPPPPSFAECADTENPFEVEWMDRAIDRHNPTQVVKYAVGEKWMYLYRSIPSAFLYDCEGNFICETRNDHDPCHDEHVAALGRGKIIWQGEGVWD